MNKSEAAFYTEGLNPGREFSAVYMNMRNLRSLLEKSPDSADDKTVHAVWDILIGERFSDQRMSQLLYRECARALAAVGKGSTDRNLSHKTLRLQVQAASSCNKYPSIEASGGLGGLPFETALPQSPEPFSGFAPSVDWNNLLKAAGAVGEPIFSGRSAIIKAEGENRIFAVKILRKSETPEGLHLEGRWMERLQSEAEKCGVRFDCPHPYTIAGHVVFRLTNLPADRPGNLHEQAYAMAYHAHSDYFIYPNDDREGRRCEAPELLEIMSRNAFILGHLAGKGIVHEAPIPLFHNRVQATRRTDQGVYEWHRFGRLDRWLDSCRYPNFGLSGLRDFEHMKVMQPGRDSFYRAVGSHFISILLVLGSWFRAKNPTLCGLDEGGNPIDARHLFDAALFEQAVSECFGSYYLGFTGSVYKGEIDLRIGKLVAIMIDEMGVDRHMFEFMRVVDQDLLEENEFRSYLIKCGMDPEKARAMEKGQEDIPLVTGPHLGDFNSTISLPEIVTWSAMAAGCCIAGRALGERWKA
ncbi:SidJ-related pseudokinase [Maridesulfovibrio sp.]|uniref:SidJ-related pseudokinase n=1 Tax=Maridesulfovibrio sp. TaxID=2795000 RepID=UPI002A189C67|nr:SidJ-related pseudokinase [Maridesulfovibrio sp.]